MCSSRFLLKVLDSSSQEVKSLHDVFENCLKATTDEIAFLTSHTEIVTNVCVL